ncbi:hypothetical protein ACQCVK_19365 [Rossellomorea vietnamensis]|uniref:hypothetical protein n=1 Tax=Rossellomorea vietnamensis TaxID=218284 RepID=UPI003CF014DE
MTNEWKLTEEKYRKLLAFIGYGDFKNADFIVFGNEEGTGGYGIEENVEARIGYYGKDENGEYVDCINPNNPLEGFWDNSASNKIARYLEDNGRENVEDIQYVKGSFLSTIARICLALEDEAANSEFWFKTFTEHPDARDHIQLHILNNLFKSNSRIKTALSDWRPLPRSTENKWPQEYHQIHPELKNNPYINAFNKVVTLPNEYRNDFSDFSQDVFKRLTILKNTFTASNSRIVLSLGGVNGMKRMP